MSACCNQVQAFGQSRDAVALVDFALQMTLPELTQKRQTLVDILEQIETSRKDQMIASPIHPGWDTVVADKAYVQHSIDLLERAMLYAPKTHDDHRRMVFDAMGRAADGD